MYLSLLVLFLTLSLLFFLPVEYLSISGLYLTSLLLIIKSYKKEIILLDWIVFFVYLVMSIVYYLLSFDDIIPFMGSFFYGSIAFCSILGAIFSKPFTLVNGEDEVTQEDMLYHRTLSLIMGIIYIPAFVTSIVLFPSATYIYVPIIISIVAIPISIFLTKYILQENPLIKDIFEFYKNRSKLIDFFDNKDGMYKIDGKYIGKEVISNGDRELFINVLRDKYYELYNQSSLKKEISYEEYFKRIEDEYKEWESNSSSFVVLNMITKKAVGSIRLVYKRDKLPVESFLPVSFDNFRKKNINCAEAGRLALLNLNGIERGKVFGMLHYLIGSRLYAKGIEILFTSAVRWQVSFYKKLNFIVVGEAYKDRETQTFDYLCLYNIPYDNKNLKSIATRQQDSLVALSEKWYMIRLLLKRIFSKFKPWNEEDLSHLVIINKGN
jgi:hypothetical protein